MLDASQKQFKRHEVPKHVHEARSLDPARTITTPKNPQEVFKVRCPTLPTPQHSIIALASPSLAWELV